MEEDDDEFTVRNRDDIIGILRDLARRFATLSAVFNHGNDILLTEVLDVDPEQNVAFIDTNVNAESNNGLLASTRTIFVAVDSTATVRWVSEHVLDGKFEGRRAFKIAIPASLRRIQRRGVFRVATPITNPVMCRVPLLKGKFVDLVLVDICIEGVGVILPTREFAELDRGAQLKNCTIALPEIGVIDVTLIVKSVWEVVLKNGSKSKRAGLEFVGIKPGVQSMVQRYVHRLDCLRIATMKDH